MHLFDARQLICGSYYVTMDCLAAATDAISAALYHLGRGDRIALYTTHCTHNVVTGTRPEQYYPIRSFSTDTERDLRLLIADICRHGTQAWQPARPNPSMTEVVLSIAKSFEKEVLKPGRTHLILLSPATYVLHDVSRAFPDLFIHRLNPGVLPYRRKPESEDTVCFRSCCKNVFVSNWNSYQSVPGCIKRLLKNARCKQPVGQITDVSIDIRLREGCELISLTGDKDVSNLRLGQAHSILAHLRVDAARAKAVDLDSANPIFNSSLDIKGLRNDLQNALALEAVKVHLLDVQLFHRNSISAIDCWNYSETPLILTRDLGGLAPPLSVFSEVVIRQCFQRFSRLVVQDAIEDAERVLHQTSTNMPTRAIVERMAKELRCHQASLQYELDCRQRLPLCAGPIATEISHDWLKDIWEKKKSKRHGMANAKENVTGPAQCIEHLDHRS